MKSKTFIKLALVLLFPLFMLNSCEQEQIINDNDLPAEITNYIQKHFADHTILQSIKELDNLSKTYEVILSGNYTLKFNRKREIIDIEGKQKLPDSVIPEKILTYVTTNFPENYIVGWELEGKKQQVELDNDIDLEFNLKGDFLRID